FQQPVRAERHLRDADAEVQQRVIEGLCHERRDRNHAGLTGPFHAQRVERRGRLQVDHLDLGNLHGGRQQVVHECLGQKLPASVIDLAGVPRTETRPSSNIRSCTRASSLVPATTSAFSRTACAARCTAFPATTAARLANVPVPHPNAPLSPVVMTMSSTGTVSASAMIWAKDVKCPCPCVPTLVAAWTLPDGSTVTRHPSYGPMPDPST